MCDKLVFDLAQEVEGQPSVFIRKDWINCLDNQNQNYNGNQSILDTSQLSNSNKYMSYRESYLSIPFTLTLGNQSITTTSVDGVPNSAFTPANSDTSVDYALGLKSWFGQIIHSFTLDYNGTTIIQQTPFINMWNSFKLTTSLSLDDILTQGPTIGLFPDDPLTWEFNTGNSLSGNGTCNNTNAIGQSPITQQWNNFKSGQGNEGFLNRQRLINFNGNADCGSGNPAPTYGSLLQGSGNPYSGSTALNQVWKSYIFNRLSQTADPTSKGVYQIAIVATVYLKHIHGFFNMIPLLKGVFMKMTMNLNNTTTGFQAISEQASVAAGSEIASSALLVNSLSNPLGGVNPVMIASAKTLVVGIDETGTADPVNIGQYALENGSANLFVYQASTDSTLATEYTVQYRVNLSVGAICLDATLKQQGALDAPLSRSIYLYIPAYTFNPVFEQAYLSNPIKTIKYTDIYQYQVVNVPNQGTFNNLITNGIANVKSVLVLPFFSANTAGSTDVYNVPINTNSGFLDGVPIWQSPFDTAGTGTTSPLCYLSNFNIQVSGQNAIYNTERYNFEQFNNQLYGQNAVNGGLTDGLTSGLISRQHFDMNYCYYYVNVERMLPAEQQVPKSIQILGSNYSAKNLDLWVFVEFGVEVKIDALTGARV
jgi:hypothetical protein